jgi:hypothetical protein
MDTERMAESTMNQGKQTMEQLIDLQRNMARMTLSAIKWQETAQNQGLEMMKSMVESAPGPQFTESMMQSYLQGMEAIMPEMERAMEQGMRAATQPQMEEMQQMGGQMEQMGSQMAGGGRMREQESRQREADQQESRQRGADQQGTSGRSEGQQMRSQQPSRQTQTGEWITPQEYAGESASATGTHQQPMSAGADRSRQYESEQFGDRSRQGGGGRPQRGSQQAPSSEGRQFERSHQQGRQTQPQTGTHQGRTQRGGPPRGDEQTRQGRRDEQTRQGRGGEERTQQRQSPGRVEQDQPTPQDHHRGRQPPAGDSHGYGSDAASPQNRSGGADLSSERQGTEELDTMSDETQRSTEGSHGNEERGTEE